MSTQSLCYDVGMGKLKGVFMAIVIVAVMIVMALRGCPRHTHGGKWKSHTHRTAP